MMQRALVFIAAAGLTAGTLFATLGKRDYRAYRHHHHHHYDHLDQDGQHRNCEAQAEDA